MSQASNAPEKGLMARLDNTAFARDHGETWKFIKFAAVSTFSAAFELVVQLAAIRAFTALGVERLPGVFQFLSSNVELRPGVTLAAMVYAFMASTTLGYTLGFFVNRKTTFHADGSIVLSTLLNVLLIVFTVVANSFLGPAITGLVLKLSFVPTGLVDTLSKVLSMLSTVLWVYPANRFIIHRNKKEAADEPDQQSA